MSVEPKKRQKTILLGFKAGELAEMQRQAIQAIAPDYRLLITDERDEIEKALDEIEIAARSFPRDLLPKARRLRWFQQWGAGADWLLRYPEAAGLDFVLTNTSGIHAIQISEHILAFLLAFARRLPEAVRNQLHKRWHRPSGDEFFELAGKTLLLVGVGAIGERTAQIAKALGMRVWGVRRDPASGAPDVEAVYGPDQLLDLLPRADMVVLTVPLTRETRGMIGERELRAMKTSAYVVNIGRGGTIQEDALVRALCEGWIAGAGLDVFEREPLPQDSPLWEFSNVIITSHIAGLTPHYDERALEVFQENLRRYQAGEPLYNVVDKKLGY
jgi:phosphoglycerate dehydrogenase-like enzyme